MHQRFAVIRAVTERCEVTHSKCKGGVFAVGEDIETSYFLFPFCRYKSCWSTQWRHDPRIARDCITSMSYLALGSQDNKCSSHSDFTESLQWLSLWCSVARLCSDWSNNLLAPSTGKIEATGRSETFVPQAPHPRKLKLIQWNLYKAELE
jgi:hypothetical protein